VLSQSNVRRLKAGVSIEDLAEDIARPRAPAEPKWLGRSSTRRRRDRPVRNPGRRPPLPCPRSPREAEAPFETASIPCIVRDPKGEISAEEDSLAENVQRVALHPLDQFRAFKALRDRGADEEEIATRFFVALAVVKQRLRLAAVSEKLLEVYAEDGMTLGAAHGLHRHYLIMPARSRSGRRFSNPTIRSRT